ncbi:preprotein translocase subunit YajC [Elusimicrobiota bacterium]
MIDLAYAMSQAPAEGQQAGSSIAGLLPLILIFFVFYFLLIRPQKKQVQQQKEMVNSLNKGDRVVTSGGIHGKITALKGKQIELEISPGTKIILNKQAISQVNSNMPAEGENESK